MNGSSEARKHLEQALNMARSREYSMAEVLEELEIGLQKARSLNDRGAIALLAKNAGLFSREDGHLSKAAGYYEEAYAVDPNDGYLCWALASLYKELDKHSAFERSLEACKKLAEANADDDLQLMILNLVNQ